MSTRYPPAKITRIIDKALENDQKGFIKKRASTAHSIIKIRYLFICSYLFLLAAA